MENGNDIISYILENNLKDKSAKYILDKLDSIIYGKTFSKNTKQKTSKNTFIECHEYYVVKVFNQNTNKYVDILIDKEDKTKVDTYTWTIFKNKKYPITHINRKSIVMHRLILDYHGTDDIDHINRNKYDNRKCNLRIVSRVENLTNNNAVGVYLQNQKWFAVVMRYGKSYRIGRFNTFEEAKEAREKKIIEIEKEKEKLLKDFIEETKDNEPGVRKTECGNWLAYITHKGKMIGLGTYKTKEEAINAREKGKIYKAENLPKQNIKNKIKKALI